MSEELLQEETTMADLEEHFDDANPWNVVQSYMENKTILPVKVEGIVNGGAIAMVEGLRGFIPASKLSLSYIEDLETYLLKDIEVRVIEADEAENRLVLSAREILKEKEKKAMEEKIANIQIKIKLFQVYFFLNENPLSDIFFAFFPIGAATEISTNHFVVIFRHLFSSYHL